VLLKLKVMRADLRGFTAGDVRKYRRAQGI
jgi:hypothetical protein